MISTTQIEELHNLCPSYYNQGHEEYYQHSAPWSTWADRKPKLAVEPRDLGTLQRVIKYLYDSDIDFCIRNTGTGGASASGVCVSMKSFKGFVFDPQSNVVTLGAGLDWGEVDQLMEEHTPGYVCIGARCSWVGITGSALVGGLSWLSHEYGMISDPQNLLDMQIVLRDGRALWATEEPDLMWALRGGGGNFGVITQLKVRARPYTQNIFSGLVMVPHTSLVECSKEVARMHAREADPKLAMHVVNQGPGLGTPNQGSTPGIGILIFDAHGETHARSDSGFAWAFRLAGAVEVGTGMKTLRETNAVANTYRNWQGRNMFWSSAPLIEHIDDETLIRAFQWYQESVELYAGFGAGSTVLLEFMQLNAFNSAGSRSACAWPHSGRRHVMQLVLGCAPENAPSDIREIAMKQLSRAGKQIALDKVTHEYHPGFLHPFNDISNVYSENYERLREIKCKYDPENRFNKGVDLMAAEVTEGMVA